MASSTHLSTARRRRPGSRRSRCGKFPRKRSPAAVRRPFFSSGRARAARRRGRRFPPTWPRAASVWPRFSTRRAALPLSVYELHALRPAVVDHRAAALRPAADFDGRLSDVPGVPGGIREPGRPPLPCPADRLSPLRARAATARPRRARTGGRRRGLDRRGARPSWPGKLSPSRASAVFNCWSMPPTPKPWPDCATASAGPTGPLPSCCRRWKMRVRTVTSRTRKPGGSFPPSRHCAVAAQGSGVSGQGSVRSRKRSIVRPTPLAPNPPTLIPNPQSLIPLWLPAIRISASCCPTRRCTIC